MDPNVKELLEMHAEFERETILTFDKLVKTLKEVAALNKAIGDRVIQQAKEIEKLKQSTTYANRTN